MYSFRLSILFITKEIKNDVTQHRNDEKTIIMNTASQINNRTILLIFSYSKGDVDKEKILSRILSTFKFTN